MASNQSTTGKKSGADLSGQWLLAAIAAIALGVGGGALWLHWKNRAPAAPMGRSGAALLQSNGEATVSGKIRPQHIVPVKAGMNGDLDAFLVDVGQEVFEGQALAHIGASGLDLARGTAEAAVREAQDQVARAESAVAAARMEWSRAAADQQRSQMARDRVQQVWYRQQTLFRAGATSRQAYEKAQRDFENARQDAETMDKAARTSSVCAPAPRLVKETRRCELRSIHLSCHASPHLAPVSFSSWRKVAVFLLQLAIKSFNSCSVGMYGNFLIGL